MSDWLLGQQSGCITVTVDALKQGLNFDLCGFQGGCSTFLLHLSLVMCFEQSKLSGCQ